MEQKELDELKVLLGRIADSNEKILGELTKPMSPVKRVFDIAVTVAAIGGITGVIDVIKSWLGG
jgi:hypothetical protein